MIRTNRQKFTKSLWEMIQIAAFVFSAQVGAGFFLLPTLLSTGGYLSFFVFFIVGLLAIITIHIFAQTGLGVQQIIEKSFGLRCSKYIYFIYWFISWFSTIVLFKELVGYCGITGLQATMLEMIIWVLVTFLNLWKLKYSMYIESLLTAIKLLPFLLLVIGYLVSPVSTAPIVNLEGVSMKLFLRCMWSFVGIEMCNIIGGNLSISPENKKKGTYLGMFVVMIFYLFSILISFYLVGNQVLVNNMAPYLTVLVFAYSNIISSNTIGYILQLLVILTLVGSINSWTISSGYTTKECGDIGILPKCMSIKNQNQVPYVGILFSSLLVLVFLLLCSSPNIYQLTVNAIDISCCFFLLIYAICILAYNKSYVKSQLGKVFYLLISMVFIIAFVTEIWKYIRIIVL